MLGRAAVTVILSATLLTACGDGGDDASGASSRSAQASTATGTGAGGGVGAGGTGAGGSGGTGGGGACSGRPAPPQAGGTTFYVAPTGDDGGPGSEAAPFATIQHAADLVIPGDTVIVEDGTYSEPGGGAIVNIDQGGTDGNWVWLRARNRWGAKLDGQGNVSSAGFRFGSDAGWVRVEGFEISGIGALDGGAGAVECYAGGHDVEIVGNHMHDLGRLCTDTDNASGVGVFLQQPNVVVDGNLIHDVGRFGPGENGCNPQNLFWQNHDHGIYVDGDAPGSSGALLVNNVFYGIEHGWAIQLYPGALANVRVALNTFSGANPYRDGHIVLDADFDGLDITDNVFHVPTDGALSLSPTLAAQGSVARRNLTTVAVMTIDPAPAGLVLEDNLLSTDPKLVGLASHDYHLGQDSPAIDAGDPLADVGWDFDGNCRPLGSGYDMGAFER